MKRKTKLPLKHLTGEKRNGISIYNPDYVLRMEKALRFYANVENHLEHNAIAKVTVDIGVKAQLALEVDDG